MTDEGKLRLDLNSPEFQRALFRLDKNAQRMVLNMLRKLFEMTWEQVYRDSGLRWEAILSKSGPSGQRLYSLRVGRGFRALATREGNFLRLLSLHPDHDAAYK